jgi:hypothetical protein
VDVLKRVQGFVEPKVGIRHVRDGVGVWVMGISMRRMFSLFF